MTTPKIPIRVGQRWARKRDGIVLTIEYIGGGSHNWLDGRLDTGRTVTVSETGLRSKYTHVPGPDDE